MCRGAYVLLGVSYSLDTQIPCATPLYLVVPSGLSAAHRTMRSIQRTCQKSSKLTETFKCSDKILKANNTGVNRDYQTIFDSP